MIICLILAATFKQECASYQWMRDGDRSIHHISSADSLKCDGDSITYGAKWFRLGWPAGTRIPQVAPSFNRCGGLSPGWATGEHPENLYQRKLVKICFLWPGHGNCYWHLMIEVTKCDGFFVYLLRPTPRCSLRYCGNGEKGKRV